MSQISRPFQIALVAIVAIALVWLMFLRGHSSSGESSSSTASSSAQPATAAKPSAASSSGSSSADSGGSQAGSTPYHGSAPGVAGLTRAITKARGAVAQSQREAKAQSNSAGAQGSSSSGSTQSSQAGSQSSSGGAAPSAKAAPGGASSAKVTGAPVQEAAVQSQLKAGRTVIILFWSPRGADDKAVRLELQLLAVLDKKIGDKANKRLAVHYAHASEVGQFGTITRSLQILQTPTMLVISPSGNTKTITGLTDAYAIQQAISEARHP